ALLLILGCLMLNGACALKDLETKKPAPPEPVAAAPLTPEPGQIIGARYVNPSLGIYWFNLGGYQPLQPGSGDSFLFGWKRGPIKARLWALPFGDLEKAADHLAQSQDWRLGAARKVAWQGFPAMDVPFSGPEGSGRLRLLAARPWILAVTAHHPRSGKEAGPEIMVTMIEGLRLIPPGDVLHTVKRASETLAVVSLWYTGSMAHWPKILKYNRLRSPLLRPGQEILIPADMIWRLDPLPAWSHRLSLPPRTGKGKAMGQPEATGRPDLELMPAGPK
ncbi:MAG: LysM peptidoglycan-binding domain-containing protein, partial [Desulfarculaceae bacterium]